MAPATQVTGVDFDVLPGLASSRARPLPQVRRMLRPVAIPVGAGVPAKGPEQAVENFQVPKHITHQNF
jgi:hypothetical protein